MIVCICNFRYQASNTHAPCDVTGSTVFFHIISYTARFLKKKNSENKLCLDFLYNFCLNHFLFKNIRARYDHKHILALTSLGLVGRNF
jgi:hypothetical protein